jgi:NMT1-like family
MVNGARFKIIGSAVRRGAVLFFVARKRFSTFTDLKRARARLGVLSEGSCSDWYMRELLRHEGLDPEAEVRIVGLGQCYQQVPAMLARGDLDGAIISEPHVSMGEEAGWFNVWLGLSRCDFVPRMQWTIMLANDVCLRDLLTHSDLRTTTRHYNRARGIEASRAHAQLLAKLRRRRL